MLRVNLGVGQVEFQSAGAALARLLDLRRERNALSERERTELAALQVELESLGLVEPEQLELLPPESGRSGGTIPIPGDR